MNRYLITILFLITISCVQKDKVITENSSKAEVVDQNKKLWLQNYFQKIRSNNLENKGFDILKHERKDDSLYSINDTIDLDNNKIRVHKNDKSIEIELSGNTHDLHSKIKVMETSSYLAVAWISRPFYRYLIGDINKRHRWNVHLKIMNKETKRTVLNKIIKSSERHIGQFDMVSDSISNSLLVTYNYNLLVYDLDQLNLTSPDPMAPHLPQTIAKHDLSSKNHTTFHSDNDHIYITQTRGRKFSMSNKTPKRELGITLLDSTNSIKYYKVLKDDYPIDHLALIQNDTIYYALINSRSYNDWIIKRISIDDIPKIKSY
jgi:hypothetical protein